MSFIRNACLGACGLMIMATAPVQAACLKKSAVATSTNESSAKWFALETMVQSVSWGLWPGFLATGNVSGYQIKKEKYNCKPAAIGVTCTGNAMFCKTG